MRCRNDRIETFYMLSNKIPSRGDRSQMPAVRPAQTGPFVQLDWTVRPSEFIGGLVPGPVAPTFPYLKLT